MTLGPALWMTSKPFYQHQSLALNGDPIERYAATTLNFDTVFRHYGDFWRYHVCPATKRPDDITFRSAVADIVSVITQRNYTVFIYLLEALEQLRLVKSGDTGPRSRNCYITLMYAGNALQVFTEFQTALCGRPGSLSGISDLATQLGVPINPFPDWRSSWSYDRDLLSTYRNYLTHQGRFYSVFKTATNQLLVRKPDAFSPGVTYTWTHAQRDYTINPSDWMPIQDLCQLVVDDTVAFLDLAYEKICNELEPMLLDPNYQALWGWLPGQPIPVLTAPPTVGTPTGVTSASTIPLGSLTGRTSTGIDDGPPGSGVVRV